MAAAPLAKLLGGSSARERDAAFSLPMVVLDANAGVAGAAGAAAAAAAPSTVVVRVKDVDAAAVARMNERDRLLVWLLERALARLDLTSETSSARERRPPYYDVVVDFEGFRLSQATAAWYGLFRRVHALLTEQYPRLVGTAYVVNAPAFFPALRVALASAVAVAATGGEAVVTFPAPRVVVVRGGWEVLAGELPHVDVAALPSTFPPWTEQPWARSTLWALALDHVSPRSDSADKAPAESPNTTTTTTTTETTAEFTHARLAALANGDEPADVDTLNRAAAFVTARTAAFERDALIVRAGLRRSLVSASASAAAPLAAPPMAPPRRPTDDVQAELEDLRRTVAFARNYMEVEREAEESRTRAMAAELRRLQDANARLRQAVHVACGRAAMERAVSVSKSDLL